MKDVRQIKQLQSQLKNLFAEAEAMSVTVKAQQKDYSLKLFNIEKLKAEINKLESDTSLKVSEHAILRYLERVKGLNIEAIEKQIVTDSVKDLVAKLGGNGKFPNNECSLVIKDYTVVTIL